MESHRARREFAARGLVGTPLMIRVRAQVNDRESAKRKTELNDEEELEKLADIIKQAMFQDYKVAYSEKGDAHKEEALSTVTVG